LEAIRIQRVRASAFPFSVTTEALSNPSPSTVIVTRPSFVVTVSGVRPFRTGTAWTTWAVERGRRAAARSRVHHGERERPGVLQGVLAGFRSRCRWVKPPKSRCRHSGNRW
jgi:hypothetical protein